MRLLILALLLATTGCSLLPTGIGATLKHDSGLLVDGHDAQGQLKEDSLDTAGAYLYWERRLSDRVIWYSEAGAGYKIREGGFFVKDSKWVGTARTDIRFRLTRQ